MFDILLFLVGIVAAALVAALLILGGISIAGGVVAGHMLERIAEMLIPGRKTGLGATGIVDQHGTIARAVLPDESGAPGQGMIQVAGELWQARSARGQPLAAGMGARVVRVERMVAIVEADSSMSQ